MYGVSRSTRGWCDLDPGRRLGYEPEDDSEVHAATIEPGPESEFQRGAQFTAPGTAP